MDFWGRIKAEPKEPELKDKVVAMRKEAGMKRKEFAEYFGIPYSTVTDWELGKRQMPDYVLRLMAYKLRVEGLIKKDMEEKT